MKRRRGSSLVAAALLVGVAGCRSPENSPTPSAETSRREPGPMPWEQAPKTEPSPTDESTVPPSGQTGGMSGTEEPPPNGPVH